MTETVGMIDVEVAFALPDQQKIVALQVPIGTTVYDAAVMSGIVDQFEGLQLAGTPIGIFGKAVKNPQAEEIRQGQRVEIYRPLTTDTNYSSILATLPCLKITRSLRSSMRPSPWRYW